MDKLWMTVLTGEADDLGVQAISVNGQLPQWMVHGCTTLEQTESEQANNLYSIAIFGEREFGNYNKPELLPPGVRINTRELSEEDVESILTSAVKQAIKIVLWKSNVADYGELVLKRHPEMREADSDLEAYYNAALAEREAVFTPEDYEEY